MFDAYDAHFCASEGMGASNGAKGGMGGGPSWDAAKISIPDCGMKANEPIELVWIL